MFIFTLPKSPGYLQFSRVVIFGSLFIEFSVGDIVLF